MLTQNVEINSPTVGEFEQSTATEILAKYELVSDLFTPSIAELEIVFSRYGGQILRSTQNPCWYGVEMPGKSICGTRTQIWNWVCKHREVLEVVAASRPVPF